ncbi:TetR family transcriptional regulator [Streptomyces albidoflavus]
MEYSPLPRPQRRKPQQTRGRETREKVLLGAARLFNAHGFDKASVRDITGAVDLQPGALYHYYKDKKELAKAVVERGFYMYAAEELEPEGERWLQLVVDSSIALAYRTPRDVFVRAANRLSTDQDQETFGTLWTSYIDRVTPILAKASDELLPGVQPAAMAAHWVSAYLGVDLMYRNRTEQVPEAIAAMNRNVLRGIATPEALMDLDLSVDRGRLLYEREEHARALSDLPTHAE